MTIYNKKQKTSIKKTIKTIKSKTKTIKSKTKTIKSKTKTIKTIKDKDIIVLDFETVSECDLPKHGAARYSEHPTTKAIVLGWKVLNQKKINFWTPDKPIPEKLKNHKGYFLCHNYKFEYHIIKNVMPKLPAHWHKLENYLCTQATAYRCGLSPSLAKLSVVLKLKTPKLKDLGNYLINKFSKPQRDRKTGELYFNEITKDDFKQICEYNKYDLLATEEVFNMLPKLHEDEFEYPLFELDKKMNYRGVNVDIRNVEKLIQAYEKYQADATIKAEKIAGRTKGDSLVINSPSAFKKWVNLGLETSRHISNTQAFTLSLLQKTLDFTMESDKSLNEALELRKVLAGAAVKKLYKFRDTSVKVGTNTKALNILQYYGAHTGRLTGRGIQPHNFVRASSDNFVEDVWDLVAGKVKLQDTPKKFKNLLRQLIIPEKGHKFLIGDFSAIETRLIFWFTGCQKGSKLYADGIDVYKDMASKIFKIPYEKITKKQRELGKKGVLSPCYGASANTFKATCFAENIIINDIQAQDIINTYHATYPEIKKAWRKLEQCFQQALFSGASEYISANVNIKFRYFKNSLKVHLPSGRILYYFMPEYNTYSGMTYGHYLSCIVRLWGSKFFENLIQAIARDWLAEALLECNESDLMTPMFTVHDEIINQCRNNEAKKALKEFERIMCMSPEWANGLPMGAECVISDRYRKI